ncbi:7698_t:CDS:2 [Dentiscutata erythropus]|uniref:7698_t:CDS:1 n=1 Tax=Dentiscutata erythropus TaxID=1348616 RepID=A0A9N9JTU2_9GLOM|nr:7698_t:CDS:2 [Dentiscutata erythropus]
MAAIDNVDSVLLFYNEYGVDWIKNAKVSPDAFVQIAIQLAYYKCYSESCSTYETASTRGFLHGRLETLRTCSVDTTAFTKAFCDPNIEQDEIISLLMKAIKSHTKYIISAINGTYLDAFLNIRSSGDLSVYFHLLGRGVDCHLLGLQSQIRDGEKSRATLFTDPSYAQAMHFKLRTSNLSPGLGFHTGMETIVPDAYAIAYIIENDKLKIGISSNKKCKETDSIIFRKALKESLDDLRKILS